MRIIAGKAKGIKIISPEGLDTRPTLDKTREAVFGSLQFEIPGSRVLDLFAGSGAMGLEALSRGALEAVFVDRSRAAVAAVRSNMKATRLNGEVYCESFETALLKQKKPFDFIFIDPPYKAGFYERAIELILQNDLLTDDGKLVLEHDGSLDVSSIEGIETLKDKKYGKAHIKLCGKAQL